jgi:hypothetical protein
MAKNKNGLLLRTFGVISRTGTGFPCWICFFIGFFAKSFYQTTLTILYNCHGAS